MQSGPSKDDLRDEALTLVDAAVSCASAENLEALDAWRRQSSEHEAAVAAAARLNAALADVPRPELGIGERFRLRLGIWWARAERYGAVAAGTAAVLLATGIAFYLAGDRPTVAATARVDAAQQPTDYRTGRRQQRELALTDGSTLWLDWSTDVAVSLTADERHVTLRSGSVAFAVTPDPERPFVVHTGDVTTRVTGTEFTVRRQGGDVDIGVIEGSVRVEGGSGSSVVLTAAQAVSATQGRIEAVVDRNPGELGTWRDGLIVFRDRPLVDALETLERYASYRLDTTQLWDSGATVSGTFFIDRADDALVSILEAQRLEARLERSNTLVLEHRPPSRP